MKQIITGLLFASSLTMGQIPPAAPATTSAPAATAAATTSAPIAPATTAGVPPVVTVPPGAPVPPLATTSAPVVTIPPQTPATTASAPIQPPAPPAPPATTAAPVATPPPINPYCPAGTALNQLGSRSNPTLPLGFSMSQNAECRSNIPGHPESRAIDFEGRLTCSNFACCLCQEITCGASGWPCEQIKIGDSGAVGVQNINVLGASSAAVWTPLGWTTGAQVDCSGLEACKRSKIRGNYVGAFQCSGDYGCESADILYEATEGSKFQCNGLFSCANANIEIVIPAGVMEIGTIEFNGQQAAQGATITIRALGQSTMVQNLECMNPTACVNTRFNVIGNVYFENCDLQGMQNLNTMPAIIQQCALAQAGAFGGNYPMHYPAYTPPAVQQPPVYQPPATYPQAPVYPQYPQYPQQPTFPAPAPPAQQPQPVAPVTPVAPTTPVTPTTPATPTNPAAPATPLPPMMSLHSQSMKCMFNECANRPIQIQVSNNFVFECLGSCQNMDLTLNVGYDPLNSFQAVERIDSLKFIRPNSGNGAKIRINTAGAAMYGMGFIELNDVRCEGLGSCRGMQLYLDGGIDMFNLNFDCNTPGDCAGCKVHQAGAQPMDCFMLSGNGMFGQGQFMPGIQYGAPAQPQYGVPAQPQPAYPGYPYYV